MKNTDKTRTWNASSPHRSGQGLVIEEETGRNIAVTYDEKDRHIVAAAPDLLAALERVLCCAAMNEDGNADEPSTMAAIDNARAALAKARG